MALSFIGYGALTALSGAAIYANLPTRYTLGHIVPTVSYLANGKLLPIEKGLAIESGEIKVSKNSVFLVLFYLG
jgi:hypothetical protein